MMKFKTLMISKAAVCILLGVPILVVPKFFYGVFGVALNAAGVFPAWEYGAAFMGNATVTWYGRHARESKGRRAIIKGMTVYNSIGCIVTVIAILNGTVNALGWGAAAIYLFFAIGFGYFWLNPPTP
jgi:hypothetical protein